MKRETKCVDTEFYGESTGAFGFSIYTVHANLCLSPGQTRKNCCRNIISYQCFIMFPSVSKLGNLNIV